MITLLGTGVTRNTWKRIRSGSIFEVAMVLKELYSLRVWKELSFGEKEDVEIARNLIKKEAFNFIR